MKRQKTKIRLKDALKQINAELIRHNKHLVYGLPNGKILTMAHSPSDNYFEAVNIRLIEKLMRVKF